MVAPHWPKALCSKQKVGEAARSAYLDANQERVSAAENLCKIFISLPVLKKLKIHFQNNGIISPWDKVADSHGPLFSQNPRTLGGCVLP